jgi:transcriptional regulator with XRE-family HTH domain
MTDTSRTPATKRASGAMKPRRAAAAGAPATAARDAGVGHSLGPVIRRARQQHRLTLQQVADRSELSVSYISQIERNLLTPSVSTLKRIALALDIPAGDLMFAPQPGATRRMVAVVRKGEHKRLAFPQSSITYSLLTPDLRRRSSALWLVAEPGAESGSAMSHEGEDIVIVLKGRLSVDVSGSWHDLDAGDSITFNSELSHRWCNRSGRVAEAIWISSPPSF